MHDQLIEKIRPFYFANKMMNFGIKSHLLASDYVLINGNWLY